jgi:hypothetical protein
MSRNIETQRPRPVAAAAAPAEATAGGGRAEAGRPTVYRYLWAHRANASRAPARWGVYDLRGMSMLMDRKVWID